MGKGTLPPLPMGYKMKEPEQEIPSLPEGYSIEEAPVKKKETGGFFGGVAKSISGLQFTSKNKGKAKSYLSTKEEPLTFEQGVSPVMSKAGTLLSGQNVLKTINQFEEEKQMAGMLKGVSSSSTGVKLPSVPEPEMDYDDPVKSMLQPIEAKIAASKKANVSESTSSMPVRQQQSAINTALLKERNGVRDLRFENSKDAEKFLFSKLDKTKIKPGQIDLSNPSSLDGYTEFDILSAMPKDNLTANIALKQYMDNRQVREAVAESSNLEEAALKLAIKKGDITGRQVEQLDSDIPNSMKGTIVLSLLQDDNLLEMAKSNPDLRSQIKQLSWELPQKYPNAAVRMLAEIISEKREQKGYNNAILNIPGVKTNNKIVDELYESGDIPLQYKLFYDDPAVQMAVNSQIKTPGAIENLTEGAAEGFLNMGKTAATVTGIRSLYKDKEQRLFTELEKQYGTVNFKPKGLLHKITANGGLITGQLLPLMGGTGLLRASNLVKNPNVANMIMAGMQTFGANMDRALADLPDATPETQLAYGTINTGLEIAFENIFNDAKFAQQLLRSGKPEIKSIINRFTNKEISEAAAKQSFENLFEKMVNAGYQFGKGTVKTAKQEAIEEAATQIFQTANNQVFGGEPITSQQAFDDAFQVYITSFLGSLPLGFGGGVIEMNKNRSMPSLMYEVASDPERYIEIVNNQASIDPEYAKDKQQKLDNINYLTQVKKELDSRGMKPEQQGKYLLKSLSEKHLSEQTSSIPDETLKKDGQQQLEKLSIEKQHILDSPGNIKIVQDYYDNELLGKMSSELLENEEGKFSPQKVGDYLKFIAQQSNSLNENWEPLGTKAPSMSDVPEEIVEIANERWKKEIEEAEQKANPVIDQIRELDMGSEEITQPIELSTELPEGYVMPEKNENLADSGEVVTLQTNEGQAKNITTKEDKGTSDRTQPSGEESPENLSKRYKRVTDENDFIDPYDRAVKYFADGGRINPSELERIFGGKGDKGARISLMKNNAGTVKQIAHYLWETDVSGKHEDTDYIDAVESALRDFSSKSAMQKDLADRYDFEAAREKYMEQAHGEKAISIVENLTDEEINEILRLESDKQNSNKLDAYIDSLILANETIPPTTEGTEPISTEEVIGTEENVTEDSGTAAKEPPGEPPVAKPTAEKSNDEQVSGIKKSLVSPKIIEGVNLDKVGDKEMMALGRKILETGEVKPEALVQKIITEKSGVLTPTEVVALITYKADIDNSLTSAYKEINERIAAGEDLGTLNVEIKDLERQRDDFDVMAVITANQQSMAFRLRKMMLDRDYNLVTQIEKYKKNNNGEISPEVEKKFIELDKELKETKAKLAEAEKREYDKEGQQSVDNIKESVGREKIYTEEELDKKIQQGVESEIAKLYEELPSEKRGLADKAISALEKFRAKIKAKGSAYDATLGIPIAIADLGAVTAIRAIKVGKTVAEAVRIGIKRIKDALRDKGIDITGWEDGYTKDLTEALELEGVSTKAVKDKPIIKEDGSVYIPNQMLRDLVARGVTDINDLTNEVHSIVVKEIPGITEREVRDYITEYGKTVNQTADDIQQQVNTAKRVGRLLSELEDLQNKKAKIKNQSSAAKITEREKDLKRRIRYLSLDLFGKQEKTDYEKISDAKERAKSRIAELERKIRNKDFAKPVKKIQHTDTELADLLAKKEKLQEEFDNEQYKLELKNRTFWQKAEDVALEATSGVIRGLVASFDLSAGFVQGLWRLFSNPKLSFQAYGTMIKHLVSQKASEDYMTKLKGTKAYPLMQASKLAIDDKSGKISAKEGLFISNWVNVIWNKIVAPVVALPVSVGTLGNVRKAYNIAKAINPYLASQRAFDGYVNSIRVNSFIQLSKSIADDGYTFEANQTEFKKAADFVNTTTGRGSLGAADASSRWLNIFLFAPRKVISEVKLFTPYAFAYYARMPKPVRRRALLNLAKFLGNFMLVNGLLWTARKDWDDDEEDNFWNPNSSDFLTHKVGNKRISIAGGAKSMIVFQSRLWSGKFTDQYGQTTKLGERYGKPINTRLDLVWRFVLGKASPAISVAAKKLDEKKNMAVDDAEIIKDLTIPIWMQDLKDLYKDSPREVSTILAALSFFGANVRVVDEKKKKSTINLKYKNSKGQYINRDATEEENKKYEDEKTKETERILGEYEKGKKVTIDRYGEVSLSPDIRGKEVDYSSLTSEQQDELLSAIKRKSAEHSKSKLEKEIKEQELKPKK